MPRSHGTFHPVPSVKLLGLCFEILDVGPPLFTSLQPERPTNGVKTGRCDRPLSLKLIACFISYEKGIHKERKECPFKAVFLMMIKGYYYSTQFCRPWFWRCTYYGANEESGPVPWQAWPTTHQSAGHLACSEGLPQHSPRPHLPSGLHFVPHRWFHKAPPARQSVDIGTG